LIYWLFSFGLSTVYVITDLKKIDSRSEFYLLRIRFAHLQWVLISMLCPISGGPM